MKKPLKPPYKVLLTLLLAGSLGACATLSSDGGEGEVRTQAARLLNQQATPATAEGRRQSSEALLAKPLHVEDAVTLLNNPRLQRQFADLRITETELVASTRPRNPSVTLARLTQGTESEVDRSIVVDVIGLLLSPLRTPIANQQYQNAKLVTVQSVLKLAHDTRVAYVEAIASVQRARYAVDVQTAAEAGRDLARSLAMAGNISRLDAAREQAFYASATANRVRAQADAALARERLVRQLGLNNDQSLTLPETLPELPATPRVLNQVEQLAMNQRIDVQLAKRHADSTAKALKLSKVTRFVNVLEVGYQQNTFSDAPKQTGVEVSLELPLFDFGSTRVAQAEAIYQRSLAQVTETAVNARSETRLAYAHYRTSYELAKHYRDEVLPLQQQIADEVLLRYNGMLISTFELLAQSQAQVDSMNAYLAALQDFWLAEAELNSSLQGAVDAG
jgi:hypothetical protein